MCAKLHTFTSTTTLTLLVEVCIFQVLNRTKTDQTVVIAHIHFCVEPLYKFMYAITTFWSVLVHFNS